MSALGESADSNEVVVNLKSILTPAASPSTQSDKDGNGGSGSGSQKPSGKCGFPLVIFLSMDFFTRTTHWGLVIPVKY